MQQTYDIQIEHVHFPLHPETPAEGQSLLDLFGGESARPRLAASQQRMAELARAEGLEMSPRTMTYNSRRAQELGAWAESMGKGPAFHDAMYHAYFVETRDISDTGVLLAAVENLGLDVKEAERVLEKRTFSAAVDEDWQHSQARGVTAVPTFEAGGEFVVGAQPYEVLEQLVVKAGAKKRE